MMNVSIVGAGYVGLISGVCLASKGHNVSCFDINGEVVTSLNKGIPTFYEKGLKKILSYVIEKQKFAAKLISDKSLFDDELIIIAVGTPSKNGAIDLGYIKQVSRLIGKYLKHNNNFLSIVIKSTVVPGTTDILVRSIIEKHSGKKLGEFGLGMNPEFLREGSAIDDFIKPDRIILGYDDKKTSILLKKLYKPWNCDKIFVNTRTAEMIKYANNSLLATQISASNELANIASAIGDIDIMDVMNGVFADKRWSPILPDNNRIYPEILSYLVPGCGFGGSCFPKDVEALRNKSYELGIKPQILDAVLKVNEDQPYEVVKSLKNLFFNDLAKKSFLFLGLAFKPGTDDIRESVSIKIINYLLTDKANIIAHDPVAIEKSIRVFNDDKNIKFVDNWEEYLSSVDIVMVATKWDEYKKLSVDKFQNILAGKVIFDMRRFFNPADFPKSVYLTIGRPIKFTEKKDI